MRLQDVIRRLDSDTISAAGVGEDEINRQASLFMDVLDQAFLMAEQGITRRDKNPLFWNLRDAFILKDLKGLTSELQYSFQSFLIRQRFSKGLEDSHKRLLDFRFPQEWFPATRAMQRTIHVHVGPTNSGKTYRALKALENSKSGIYAGPLRLLATEVYQRFTARGIPCALLTGEEIRIPEDTDQYFQSCTVEMTPFNTKFDVAVIDEIQLLGDHDRGPAWTNALLGVQAKEVHVCGEERTVNLIQAICASVGEECIVHKYERLSPLETMDEPIGNDYNNLQKGDAVVAFSRVNLHTMKRGIEVATGRRCAIVYGNLPPEVRVQQAALFNDPDNDYDFIVASDAIGMGLNLEIRRVVMESVWKFDGHQQRMLTFPELKQIGGRAGRYRSAQNASESTTRTEAEGKKVGYVTSMDKDDLRPIHRAFTTPNEDLKTAYVSAPAYAVERFASYFPPDTPLSFILMRIRELASVGSLYTFTLQADVLELVDKIQDIPLSIQDRLTLSSIPINVRADGATAVFRALARMISRNQNGDLLDIKEMPLEFLDINQREYEGSPHDYLWKLESLHNSINMYVWLSYRYSGIFRDQSLAFYIRKLVEQRLVDALERLDFTDTDLESKRKMFRQEAASRLAASEAIRENELKDAQEEDVVEYDSPVASEDEYTPLDDEEGEEGAGTEEKASAVAAR